MALPILETAAALARSSMNAGEDIPFFEHWQANPRTFVFSMPEGSDFADALSVVFEIHASRTDRTVLANHVESAPGAVSEIEVLWTSSQMNLDLAGCASKIFWLVAFALYDPEGADTSNSVIHLGAWPFRLWSDAASASTDSVDPESLWALASDVTELEGRVDNLEAGGGGGGAVNLGSLIHAATAKATPVDADEFGQADSAASYATKKTTWAQIKTTLKTYFDTLYGALADMLALGETSTTAYRGDRGKTAYDHSQITAGNPHGTTMAHISGLEDALDGKADLDVSGKVPASQLPESIVGALNYQGAWNATSNSPTLADGTGTKGYYYVVATGGTRNLGSGSIEFAAGDWAVHNGTVWSKLDATDQVTSVAGKTGVVTLNSEDITGLSGTVTDDLTAAFTAIDDLTNDVAARLVAVNNLSDLPAPSIARTNLGLGTAATATTGTSAGNVVVLDGSAKLPAIDGSQLTNLPGAATVHCAVVETDFSLSTASGVQAALPSSRDVFTLEVSTWYEFEFCYMVTRATNSVTTALAFEIGGGGSVSPFTYNVHGRTGGAANATGSGVEGFVTTEASTVVLATASTGGVIRGKGFFKTGASGTPTFTPKINWSGTAAGSPTMLAGSYVKVTPAAATSGNVG